MSSIKKSRSCGFGPRWRPEELPKSCGTVMVVGGQVRLVFRLNVSVSSWLSKSCSWCSNWSLSFENLFFDNWFRSRWRKLLLHLDVWIDGVHAEIEIGRILLIVLWTNMRTGLRSRCENIAGATSLTDKNGWDAHLDKFTRLSSEIKPWTRTIFLFSLDSLSIFYCEFVTFFRNFLWLTGGFETLEDDFSPAKPMLNSVEDMITAIDWCDTGFLLNISRDAIFFATFQVENPFENERMSKKKLQHCALVLPDERIRSLKSDRWKTVTSCKESFGIFWM